MGDSKRTGLAPAAIRPSFRGHLAIMRMDHWVKNVFVLPGTVVALSIDHSRLAAFNIWTFLVGIAAVCLISSSNYVLNEVLDAPHDLTHPTKCQRPVPSGQVSIPWAYAEWLALMVAGRVDNVVDGFDVAATSVLEGHAQHALERLVELSNA